MRRFAFNICYYAIAIPLALKFGNWLCRIWGLN